MAAWLGSVWGCVFSGPGESRGLLRTPRFPRVSSAGCGCEAGAGRDSRLARATTVPARGRRGIVAGMGSPPTSIGPHQVIRKLGEGGMGAVFEAMNPAIERRVALKVPACAVRQ